MKRRKSWQEKFENPPEGLPKVVEVPPTWQKQMGGKMILVPTPKLTDAIIRKVPKGKLITTAQIRAKLAADFKADSTCPLTPGIFLRIISEYAEEQRHQAKGHITPYWRALKDGGKLNAKYPGGIPAHARLLRQEGHRITGHGNTARITDYQKSFVS